MSAFEHFQKIMVALSARHDENMLGKAARRMSLLAGRALKSAEPVQILAGLGQAAATHDDEAASWISIDDFVKGVAGPFDAADLRHWLRLAELAGVDAVPAVEVLRLTDEEASTLSGSASASEQVRIGALAAAREITDAMARGEPMPETEDAARILSLLTPGGEDRSSLQERLYGAMEHVPSGWMVRSARTGPSGLKALAGSGHAGAGNPAIVFDPGIEVGAGWIREGNMRRLVVDDMRTITAIARGPSGCAAFLARPWQKAARYFVHDDPHRRETPLRGPGVWPAEWRAFVEDGKVVGVSSYYSWIGEANAANALAALDVAEKAQAIADKAAEIGMLPRFMDLEYLRKNRNPEVLADGRIASLLDRFGRDKVACTLDFIETEDGLKLLEGGPPNTPVGGGHPCGFAGCGGLPSRGSGTETVGVAFRNMPHVLPGDPKTWTDGDRTGCVLSWEDVQLLAAGLDLSDATPSLR